MIFALCFSHKAFADNPCSDTQLTTDLYVNSSWSDSLEYKLVDSLNNEINNTTKKKNTLFKRVGKVLDGVTNFFMGCDTAYVTPQLYELTAQAELSYWHDYYRMSSSETGNTNHMTLQSGNPLILGGYVYWSIFGYGHSVNLEDLGNPYHTVGKGTRNYFMLNTARIVAEMYTFKSGHNARFTHISGVNFRKGDDREFTGLASKCFGIDAQYIFNHKKYSWPAAFGENAVQRRSQGSWKLGFSYNRINVKFDKTQLSAQIKSNIDSTLIFNNVGYNDYAISFGYGYNWVFARNCLLAISALPSLGYRHTNITDIDNAHDILKNISTDVIFRTSLFWNNTRSFSGIVFDFHTYSYRQRKFGLTNTYGTIKLIMGVNFIKKSQYKEKKK